MAVVTSTHRCGHHTGRDEAGAPLPRRHVSEPLGAARPWEPHTRSRVHLNISQDVGTRRTHLAVVTVTEARSPQQFIRNGPANDRLGR